LLTKFDASLLARVIETGDECLLNICLDKRGGGDVSAKKGEKKKFNLRCKQKQVDGIANSLQRMKTCEGMCICK